jgi:hypothetical protein
MADFDKIVRPFQIKPNLAAIPERVQEVRKSETPITRRFGGGGSGKTVSGSFSLELKAFHETQVLEVGKRQD